MRLQALGFSAFFRTSFEQLGEPSLAVARVVRADPTRLRLSAEHGEVTATVGGRLRHGETGPIVAGDWVAFDPVGHVVRHVLTRRTAFVRQAAGRATGPQVVAANIDLAFILMGLDEDFSPPRLARYLAVAHASGAIPVVLLTKVGSATRREERVAATRAAAGEVAVHAIDVIDAIAPDAPGSHLAPGLTAALLGSSGVGKSTLLNHLLGHDVARTAPTRASDDTGRHTTTHRELFELPSGAMIIDTPGMRELALWCDAEAVDAAFDDLSRIASGCRFNDCRHRGEPGCAVRRAIDDGSLDADRLETFAKLQRELERTQQRRRAWERGKEGRLGSKMVREAMRHKYGRDR